MSAFKAGGEVETEAVIGIEKREGVGTKTEIGKEGEAKRDDVVGIRRGKGVAAKIRREAGARKGAGVKTVNVESTGASPQGDTLDAA